MTYTTVGAPTVPDVVPFRFSLRRGWIVAWLASLICAAIYLISASMPVSPQVTITGAYELQLKFGGVDLPETTVGQRLTVESATGRYSGEVTTVTAIPGAPAKEVVLQLNQRPIEAPVLYSTAAVSYPDSSFFRILIGV